MIMVIDGSITADEMKEIIEENQESQRREGEKRSSLYDKKFPVV